MDANLPSLSDVIGYREIKEVFLNTYQENVKMFLFIGAIHNGKHFVSKALANSLDLPLHIVSKEEMGENDTEKSAKLNDLLELAKKEKRMMILFDSAELVFEENKVGEEVIVNFLKQLDELDKDEYKIRIILNAEVPSYIDKNLIQDTFVCRFTLPEVFERKELIKRLVGEKYYSKNQEVLDYIAKESNYYAYGELKKYINKLMKMKEKLTYDNISFKKADIKLFDEYGYEFIEDYCND